MDDNKIIDLYWKRSESAITETDKKYGRYCNTIAFNILHNREDAEECVNDTYFKVWGGNTYVTSSEILCVYWKNHTEPFTE